ncbi:MAG: hypothetical protein QXR97_04890 [Thermoproteota archaeon]
MDCDLFQRVKLVKRGGTSVADSMRLFSEDGLGLGILELDREVLGAPEFVYGKRKDYGIMFYSEWPYYDT